MTIRSTVRHLSVLSAIVEFGGNPSKWEDTWKTESDSAIEKNVDKTESWAQGSPTVRRKRHTYTHRQTRTRSKTHVSSRTRIHSQPQDGIGPRHRDSNFQSQKCPRRSLS
ncbi:hypothetical protein NQZ68_000605 [Dissostichus eleginoides]|nr:hypothetical protein NQZ68_000605 [Dissostichus eleginoides]